MLIDDLHHLHQKTSCLSRHFGIEKGSRLSIKIYYLICERLTKLCISVGKTYKIVHLRGRHLPFFLSMYSWASMSFSTSMASCSLYPWVACSSVSMVRICVA